MEKPGPRPRAETVARSLSQGTSPTSQNKDHFRHVPFYPSQNSTSTLPGKMLKSHQEFLDIHVKFTVELNGTFEPALKISGCSLVPASPWSCPQCQQCSIASVRAGSGQPGPIFPMSAPPCSHPWKSRLKDLIWLHLAYWRDLLVCTADLTDDKFVEI